MLLSILILTHNRPTLFKRCISSVIDNFIESQFDIEVIVNNDTRDITEVYDDRFDIRYMYECDNDYVVIVNINILLSAGECMMDCLSETMPS